MFLKRFANCPSSQRGQFFFMFLLQQGQPPSNPAANGRSQCQPVWILFTWNGDEYVQVSDQKDIVINLSLISCPIHMLLARSTACSLHDPLKPRFQGLINVDIREVSSPLRRAPASVSVKIIICLLHVHHFPQLVLNLFCRFPSNDAAF